MTRISTRPQSNGGGFYRKQRSYSLYAFGDIPVSLLKYLPKKDWDGKLSSSPICCMVILVDLNSALDIEFTPTFL